MSQQLNRTNSAKHCNFFVIVKFLKNDTIHHQASIAKAVRQNDRSFTRKRLYACRKNRRRCFAYKKTMWLNGMRKIFPATNISEKRYRAPSLLTSNCNEITKNNIMKRFNIFKFLKGFLKGMLVISLLYAWIGLPIFAAKEAAESVRNFSIKY